MTEPEKPDSIRLSKYLALQLGISRREADDLIDQGKVRLNGEEARLGARMHPDDTVLVRGKPLTSTVHTEYLAFHKPVGYVSSRRAQGDNPTIYALLPPNYHALKPVGRLDKDSSGILLLTNDGDFAYQMTHPKFYKTKIYNVRLSHDLEPLHQQMINDYGVKLEDGTSKLTLERLSENSRKEWQVTMTEGRNRQIRRTFAALGYTVTHLHRTQFGSYALGNLKPGDFKLVDRTG